MMIGCDTETHRFRSGWMTPRMVCMSLATTREETYALERLIQKQPGSWLRRDLETGVRPGSPADDLYGVRVEAMDPYPGFLLDRTAAKAIWPALLEHDLVFHQAPYDVRVMINEVRSSTAAVRDLIEEGRLWDTVVREKLRFNAYGQLSLRLDPWTGNRTKEKLNTLSTCVGRYFGVDLREEKTDPEAWRLRYAELEDLELGLWPEGAIEYAILDAVWALLIASAQDQAHDLTVAGWPTRCQIDTRVSPALPAIPDGIRRFAGEWHQSRIGLSFTSASSWGWRTDPRRTKITVDEWTQAVHGGAEVAKAAGFVYDNPKTKTGYSVRQNLLREMVAAAYGDIPLQVIDAKAIKAELDAQLDPEVYTGRARKDAVKDLWEAGRRAWTNAACDALGLDPDLYTDSGKVSFRAEVLADCGDPNLEAWAASGNARTYLERYAPMLIEANKLPLTYDVDTMKATMRSSKRNPTYDQPPRRGIPREEDEQPPADWPLAPWWFYHLGFRECHVPRPGKVFLMADIDQAELRAFAQILLWWGLGDGGLLEMFRQGIDPHEVIAADLLNADGQATPDGSAQWDHELVRAARKGKYGEAWAELADDYRQLAKAVNFGKRGGLGAPTFVKFAKSRGVKNIDVERARFALAVFAERFPMDMEYLRMIGNDLGDSKRMTVALPFTGLVRGGVTYTSGANGNFQHLIAAVLGLIVWRIWVEQHVETDSPLYGTRTLLPLHDEVILEVEEDVGHECAIRVEEIVCEAMRHHLPDVPPKTEAVLSRVWSKGAKRVVDPGTGRIVPWEPPT